MSSPDDDVAGAGQCESGWCPKQEKLLQRWGEKAAGYRWLHNHARLHFKRQNDRLSYPSIIISSITGVGGFAVLGPTDHERDPETQQKIVILQYFFAFLNVVGGILNSIAKFSQSSYLAEQHALFANNYSKFYRAIDMELSIDRGNRPPMLEYVKKMRDNYDKLLDDAPQIPAVSIAAFNERFKEEKGMARPDICNGLSIITDDVRDRDRRIERNWSIVRAFFNRGALSNRRSVDEQV